MLDHLDVAIWFETYQGHAVRQLKGAFIMFLRPSSYLKLLFKVSEAVRWTPPLSPGASLRAICGRAHLGLHAAAPSDTSRQMPLCEKHSKELCHCTPVASPGNWVGDGAF